MTDLTVKYFSSGMTGAPQIANNWGDLVTMLDACLINGFALKAIDTLTFADGIAHGDHFLGPRLSAISAWSRSLALSSRVQRTVPRADGDDDHVHLRGDRHARLTRHDGDESLGRRSFRWGGRNRSRRLEQGGLPQQEPAVPQTHSADRRQPQDAMNTTTWAKWANVGIVEDLSDIDIVGAQAPYDPNNPTQNWKQVTANQWVGTSGTRAPDRQYEAMVRRRRWGATGCSSATTACSSLRHQRRRATVGMAQFLPASATSRASNRRQLRRCWLPTTSLLGLNMSNYWLSGPVQRLRVGVVLDFTGKVLLRNHTQLRQPGAVWAHVP